LRFRNILDSTRQLTNGPKQRRFIPNELDSGALIANVDEQSLFQRWRQKRQADIQREVRFNA